MCALPSLLCDTIRGIFFFSLPEVKEVEQIQSEDFFFSYMKMGILKKKKWEGGEEIKYLFMDSLLVATH